MLSGFVKKSNKEHHCPACKAVMWIKSHILNYWFIECRNPNCKGLEDACSLCGQEAWQLPIGSLKKVDNLHICRACRFYDEDDFRAFKQRMDGAA